MTLKKVEFAREPLEGYTRVEPERNRAFLGALQYVDLREGDVQIRIYNFAKDIFDLKNRPLVRLRIGEDCSLKLQVHDHRGIDQITLHPGEHHFGLNPQELNRGNLIDDFVQDFFEEERDRGEVVSDSLQARVRWAAEERFPQRPLGYKIEYGLHRI